MRVGKNKKGLSLVELIAVMAISVVVVGAALLALYGGSRGATDGAADYANHGDAHLLETWLRDNLPTATGVSTSSGTPSGGTASASGDTAYRLFFTPDGSFEIARKDKSVLQISGIRSFTVSTAGAGNRQNFKYAITAAGGGRTFRLTGGIVLNNVGSGSENLQETTLSPSDTGAVLRVQPPTG